MEVEKTAIPDVLILKPKVYCDERGYFMETFRANSFADLGLSQPFVQDNHSRSKRGVLRGLHYQIRQAQGKLVRCVVGEIFDVAVDLRRSSPTFGYWVGMRLSDQNKLQLWIPPGFAHGFYVISEWADVIYKTTDFYAPSWERCLLWNDPTLGIEWPLMNGQPPLVSEKDLQGKPFLEAEIFDQEKIH
jgi:dTDP-4-dehydrorhamnose 3,5-epimerase